MSNSEPALPVDGDVQAWTCDPPEPARPRGITFGQVCLHVGLLVATFFTTTFMGTLLSIDVPVPEEAGLAGLATAIFGAVTTDGTYIGSGLVFSITLLVILGAHEMGHYIACRYYGIDASLPYFLPAPPPILIGTFGAFIRIRSPFPNRKSLFDVGVAGPIAGFVFALPASVVGLIFATPATADASEGGIIFHDPLLFTLLARMLDLPEAINWNPIYFAAWIGMFATGLNLIPVGQLDGGHAVAALAGRRGHRAVSLVFFGIVATLAIVSFIRYSSPVWFLYVAILALLAFRPHPATLDDGPGVGRTRWIVAAIVLVIFLLSFMPFPVTIT
ncbi:MAG: site-2 protease family protein [Blastocatellia bacterium]|nr:site-2 protease family protein [Blastocatellia bacterium]MBK6425679.1 site-2 protease family protein [Blastocatellia bacterium]